MNYKDTIFLPQTSFPMKASLKTMEGNMLDSWKSVDVYSKLREKSGGRAKFVLHDGPPFANGLPHAGTAMNKVLKDIIVRLKQMQGYDAPFIPGWDCHGLPIEWKIEEQLRANGRDRASVSSVEYRDLCRDFAMHWINVQREGFKRLGVNAEWEHPYLTMDPRNEAQIVQNLCNMLRSGAIVRGEKPVFWSVVEKTALADAEIEYKEKESSSIFVAFAVREACDADLLGAECVIWTTTPWTLPGNRAIAFMEGANYALVQLGGRKFVIAHDLVESVLGKISADEWKILKQNIDLRGMVCAHPMDGYDFPVPLLPGSHVTLDSGTGLVHTAPGHGLEDFSLCKEHGIAVPATVDEGGIYYDSVPLFAGKHIFRVEDEVFAALGDALLAVEKMMHSYPHSWRSKSPLIYRTTPQWFVSLDANDLRSDALCNIEKIAWIPGIGKNRIRAFVENRGDWCISRQRLWGVPLPIFVHKKGGDVLIDDNVFSNIVSIFEREGSNAWYARPAQDFLGSSYDAEDFIQCRDTVDVWFESSSSYSYVLEHDQDARCVADLYLEGSDQHRGWFQHSLLVSLANGNGAPFRSVLTHGFIVDEHGRKMSKSLGNTLNLADIVDEFGAEIFRLWVTASDFTQDLKLSKNMLRQQEGVYRKIRNTLRYLLGALHGGAENIAYEDLDVLERYILHKIFVLHSELMDCIQKYDINRYFSLVYNFCAQELSAFFFDVRKDVLYCDSVNSMRRRGYCLVLRILLDYLLRWLAPILVFTTDEAWSVARESGILSADSPSVHCEDFLIPEAMWQNDQLCSRVEHLISVRKVLTERLERARERKVIGASLEARVLVFDPHYLLNDLCSTEIADAVIVSSVQIVDTLWSDVCEEDKVCFSGDAEQQSLYVKIERLSGDKCERCWKYGEGALCARCAAVVGDM